MNKEWACARHGAFEGETARCPLCAAQGTREYRTAPAVRSERTGQLDTLLRRELENRGMTDVRRAPASPTRDPGKTWSTWGDSAAYGLEAPHGEPAITPCVPAHLVPGR